MSLQQLYLTLLVGGLVLLASIVATRVATRVGLPSLLLYLGVGVLLGEDALGMQFDDVRAGQEHRHGRAGRHPRRRRADHPFRRRPQGPGARWRARHRRRRRSAWRSPRRAPTCCSASAGSSRCCWAPSCPRPTPPRCSRCCASLPLPRRIAGLLEAESGFNDAPAVILRAHVQRDATSRSNPACAVSRPGLRAARRRSAIGLAGAFLGAAFAVSRCRRPGCTRSRPSGLACRLRRRGRRPRQRIPRRLPVRGRPGQLGTAAPRGNAVLRRRARLAGADRAVRAARTARGSSELAVEVVPAIVIGLVLLLVARPLRSWRRCRIPGAMARTGLPVVGGIARRRAHRAGDVPDRRGRARQPRLLNIVFILVVVFTLVQGPSLRRSPTRLGLIPRDATREIQVEAAPLDVLEAELLTMTVQPASRLHNVTVLELRLPDPSVITLIIRDGHTFVPLPDTRIEAGDELLIVTTTKTRAAAEGRLRAVSRRGKLAYWFDEYGEPD